MLVIAHTILRSPSVLTDGASGLIANPTTPGRLPYLNSYSMFLVWLGERHLEACLVTASSMIIMAGIVAEVLCELDIPTPSGKWWRSCYD